MLTRGNFIPSSFLTPNAPIQILTINQFSEYIRLINNSPYQLTVNMDGNIVNITDFRVKDILLNGLVHSVTIRPSINILSFGHGQSNLLTVEEYDKGEIVAPVDSPIPQQAVTTTASGKPLFSANADFPSTATTTQTLNIFNPANSGVIMTFHQCLNETNDAGFPGANLFIAMGADNNYSTPVNIVSHRGASVIPISIGHATSQDNVALPPGTAAEVLRCQQFAPNKVLDFPDVFELYPGGNYSLTLTGSASGKTTHLEMKWTEDQVVPPVLITGATAVASSVKNDGNVSGTQIVESTVSGDSASAVLISNSGTETLGDTAHPGQLQVTDGVNTATLVGNSLTLNRINLAQGGFTRVSLSAQITVTTGIAAYNHGLGVVPDVVIPIPIRGPAVAQTVYVDFTSFTSTQVTLQAEPNNTNCFLLSFKF